jgi:hypothetical protein
MGIVFYCCSSRCLNLSRVRRLDFYKNNKQFSPQVFPPDAAAVGVNRASNPRRTAVTFVTCCSCGAVKYQFISGTNIFSS